MTRWPGFFGRHDFPLHLYAVARKIHMILVTRWSTALLKLHLRAAGAAYGTGLSATGPVVVRAHRRGLIRLGERVRFVSAFRANLVGLTNPVVLDVSGGGEIVVGDDSGMSSVVLSSRSAIRIGAFVKMGGNVRIYDHDYHSLDSAIRRTAADADHARTKPVTIGDDVFIGTNSIVLKGVTIGARSIVGAGSVVTRSVPEDEIWAGNPAVFVRKLKATPAPEGGTGAG